jgi:hypothetical protein
MASPQFGLSRLSRSWIALGDGRFWSLFAPAALGVP